MRSWGVTPASVSLWKHYPSLIDTDCEMAWRTLRTLTIYAFEMSHTRLEAPISRCLYPVK